MREVYASSGASVHVREGQSLPPDLDAARKRKRATGTDEDMLDLWLMSERRRPRFFSDLP